MESTNKAQHLLTINKDTAIGTSLLKNVTYNTATVVTTSATLLSSFLYTQKVIEFMTLTSNSVTFELGGLPIHKKVIVRARVFTECTT